MRIQLKMNVRLETVRCSIVTQSLEIKVHIKIRDINHTGSEPDIRLLLLLLLLLLV